MREPGRRHGTIGQALAATGMREENWPMVQHLVGAYEVIEYVETSGYLKVVCADGSDKLRIYPGYTCGFESRAEAIALAGTHLMSEPYRCKRFRSSWGISHPICRGPRKSREGESS